MILFDFSALMYQSIFSGVSNMQPELDSTGHYITEQFLPFTKYYIFENLFNVQNSFNAYGDIVLCMDDHTVPNWRRRVYPGYKLSRKDSRDQSQIRFDEVFSEINTLIEVVRNDTPWKVVQTPQAEGDDVILVLAKQYAPKEKILIVSSDKDMLQAQKYGDVKQYSLFTQQYVDVDTKHEESINDWLLDHVILGDEADEVPKVTDDTEFSKEFQEFMESLGQNWSVLDFMGFEESRKESITNRFLNSSYSEPYTVKTRKSKNNPTGEKLFQPGVFSSPRFGKVTLRKKITDYGSLDKWLDSNALYRRNYERNKQLVLADFIPTDIYQDILYAYREAPAEYRELEFNAYIDDNNIQGVKSLYPVNFTTDLKVEDFF